MTQDELKSILYYNPYTGLFTWLKNCGRQIIGDNAGHISKGYIRITIKGRRYYAHRLAFLYMTGKFPKNIIDHRNTIKYHNWWSNLREADNQQNQENIKKARVHNKSGFLGVTTLSNNRFQATISVKGVKKHLGVFKTPESAHQKYLEAKRNLHEFNTL